MFKEQLQKGQPQIYTVLKNALTHNRLAHAYMFSGDKTTPKKETAILVAQSLVCRNLVDGFACETCDACKRVALKNYADMVYLDGQDVSIKKEDIISLKKEFSKTNVEGYGKKVYIIEHAENATSSALNSILTFLEEPQNETIAIFIVDQPELMLDTIKSRCQILQFKKQNREAYMQQLLEELDAFDAYALSFKTNSIEQALNVQESEEYQHAVYTFKSYIDQVCNRDRRANIFLQNEGIAKGKIDNKKVFTYFLEFLDTLGSDKLAGHSIEDVWYKERLEKLTNEQAITLKQVSNIILDKNVKSANMNLLVDEFIYEMEKFYE